MAPYSPIQKALGGKPYDYTATDAASQEQAYNADKTRQTVNANRALVKAKRVPVKAHTRTVKPRVKSPKKTSPSPAPAPQGGIDATTRSLIDAAVRLKFGGQDQALQQQLNQNARFTSGVPAWYSQAIQQIKAQATPVPQTAMPAPTGDPATDSRNAAAYAYQQQRGNAIGAGNQFLTNVGAGLTAAQGNTLNAANAERQGLLGQQTQLAGQKGDFKTQYTAQLQAADAKNQMDRAKLDAEMQALGLKTQQFNEVTKPLAQSLIGDRAAGQKIARIKARNEKMAADRRYQLDKQKFGQATAKDNYLKTHKLGPYKAGGSGGGSSGTYSKSKLQSFDEKWNYAKATAVQLFHKGSYTDKRTKKTLPISVDVAYGALLGQIKDPDIAKAATYAAFGKKLPPDLVHRLAVKGIHPGDIKIKPSVGGGPLGTGSMP